MLARRRSGSTRHTKQSPAGSLNTQLQSHASRSISTIPSSPLRSSSSNVRNVVESRSKTPIIRSLPCGSARGIRSGMTISDLVSPSHATDHQLGCIPEHPGNPTGRASAVCSVTRRIYDTHLCDLGTPRHHLRQLFHLSGRHLRIHLCPGAE
jgi:hypothetical protein